MPDPQSDSQRGWQLDVSESAVWVATLVTASGGFLDAFTYFGHGRVFANAMTANLVLCSAYAAIGDYEQSIRRFWPILAFLCGVATAQLFKLPGVLRVVRYPALACLSAEILFLAGAGFLPAETKDIHLTLWISYVAALQSTTFSRIEKWAYNSTMATGNLRKFGEAAFDAIFRRAEPDAARAAMLFFVITAAFAGGAVLGGYCTVRLQNRALWVAAALLLAVWVPLVRPILARRPSK